MLQPQMQSTSSDSSGSWVYEAQGKIWLIAFVDLIAVMTL